MTTSWIDLLDTTIQACGKYGRPDLGSRLRDRRTQLLAPTLRVLVLGEQGQGKSELVNALVGAPVCAVGDGLTTKAPTVISYAERAQARIVRPGPERGALESGPPPGEKVETRTETPVETPIESASARANETADGTDEQVHAQVGLPAPLLHSGLVLVDTPGIGGAHSARTASVLSELLTADAVVLASDATTELSTSELELLSNVAGVCPAVVVALTKTDLVPGWRRVLEANRAHLARARLDTDVLAVSSSVRIAAARTRDAELATESGFDELHRHLEREWLGQAEALGRRSVATLTSMAIDQLLGPLREQLETAQQGGNSEMKARWRAAGGELEELQREATRVQTVLSDEVTDLMADVEFDLRERTRSILAEAEEYFDAADPSRTWREFEQWLADNLTNAAKTNFDWLLARFDWLARSIAAQSSCAEQKMRAALLPESSPSDPAGNVRMPAVEHFGVGQKLFVGMRGSYGGLLMVGLATTLADMHLINPISVSAGVAFGVKSVSEELAVRRKRRQAAAKSAAQRHIDDFFLVYNKESKDFARRMQRTLRDRFSEFSQQQRTDVAATVNSLKETIDAETARRSVRARELKAGVDQLTALRAKIQSMSGPQRALAATSGLPA